MTSESLVMTSGSLVMTSDLHVISLVTFMTCHFTCQVPLDRVVWESDPLGGGGGVLTSRQTPPKGRDGDAVVECLPGPRA